jgi:hypothetical protein
MKTRCLNISISQLAFKNRELTGNWVPGNTLLGVRMSFLTIRDHRTVMPTVEHINHVYANNRAEVSHQPTRQQEYSMRGFTAASQAQRFLTLHGLTQNLFRLGRHLMLKTFF